MTAEIIEYFFTTKNEDNRYNYTYESIAHISDEKCIIFPELMWNVSQRETVNNPIVYDFKTGNEYKIIVNDNNIKLYRVTDMTDVDESGIFYMISLNYNSQSIKYFGDTTNFRSIVKAKYDPKGEITLLKKIDITSTPSIATPNFEGMVRISHNEFILASNNYSLGTDNANNCLVYVYIGDDETIETNAIEFNLCVNNNRIAPETCNSFQFSSIFKTRHGIYIIPKNMKKMDSYITFFISNEEINCLKNYFKLKIAGHIQNDVTPSVNSSIVKLNINVFCKTKILNCYVYDGITALTTDGCGNLFGLTEWSGGLNLKCKGSLAIPLCGKLL